MKKILYILIALPLCLMTSCSGRDGIDGRNGRDGRDGRDGLDGAFAIHNVLINVDPENWELTTYKDNNYYFASVDMPEITKDVFKGGMIKMYRVFGNESYTEILDNACQIEMPYVRPVEEVDDIETFRYIETVDYDFNIGRLTIYYTTSDFFYGKKPDPMQFRCAILY